jgi:hypothetical protein
MITWDSGVEQVYDHVEIWVRTGLPFRGDLGLNKSSGIVLVVREVSKPVGSSEETVKPVTQCHRLRGTVEYLKRLYMD